MVKKLKLLKNKAFSYTLKILLGAGIIVLLYFEAEKVFRDFDFRLVEKHIHELTIQQILLLLLIGAIAVIPMCFYDFLLLKYLGIKLPLFKKLRYSYAANTYSNFLGFGGVGGAALRVYFYQKQHTDKMALVKMIASLSIFFLTGLSLICWSVAFNWFQTPVLDEHTWLKFVIWGFSLYTPLLLVIQWFSPTKIKILFSFKYVLGFIIVSFFEWAFVLLTIWTIIVVLGVPLAFSAVIPITIVSICAGIISMIPGGVGSFDLIFLLGSEMAGVKAEEVLLALALYRLIYYIFPFLIGSLLFVVEWIKDRFMNKGKS